MRKLSKAEDRVELKGCSAAGLGLMGLLMTTQEPGMAHWLPVAVTLFLGGVLLIVGANTPRFVEYWEAS